MKSLHDIAIQYVDNIRFGTDKGTHGFASFYEELIGSLREQPCAILEVGVHSGASIRMWREAFPQATIVGIDLRLDYTHPIQHPQTFLYEGDVMTTDVLQRAVKEHGPFDLVVDDAAHTAKCTSAIVNAVWPFGIKPGGWLSIEDTHNKNAQGLFEYVKHWTFLANHENRCGSCGRGRWKHKPSAAIAEIHQVIYRYGIMAVQRYRA